jgi:hypothetical protein
MKALLKASLNPKTVWVWPSFKTCWLIVITFVFVGGGKFSFDARLFSPNTYSQAKSMQ